MDKSYRSYGWISRHTTEGTMEKVETAVPRRRETSQGTVQGRKELQKFTIREGK